MTSAERERLAVVETKLAAIETWTINADRRFDKFDEKLDKLAAAASEGRGREKQKAALWSVGGGIIGSVLTAVAEYVRHL
jgi:hypothetical protein